MTAAEPQLTQIPPTLEGYIMYLLKVVTTTPADMLNLMMVYAPWGILVGFILARVRLALARRTPKSAPPPTASSPDAPSDPATEPPSKQEATAPDPSGAPEPKTSGDNSRPTTPSPGYPPPPLKQQMLRCSPNPSLPLRPTPSPRLRPPLLENRTRPQHQPTPLPHQS